MESLPEIFLMAIVVYLLYRFIVNFLMPIMRATRQVREQFRNMQDQANGGAGPNHDASRGGFQPGAGFGPNAGFRPGTGFQQSANAGRQPGTGDRRTSAKPPADDYIDFEEIK